MAGTHAAKATSIALTGVITVTGGDAFGNLGTAQIVVAFTPGP
jgi:hypothetical protein